jgi:hypothetical protein
MPADFQTSMYKLLGESVIADMGSQGQPPGKEISSRMNQPST